MPFLIPERAQLICLDDDKLSLKAGIDGIQFNPGSLSLSRATSGGGEGDSHADRPYGSLLKSGTGANDKLSFELMLDASESPSFDLADPKGPIQKLYLLTYPIKVKGSEQVRLPFVAFQWGKNFLFQGVVTSVDINVTLFDAAGRFKRAKATPNLEGWAFQKRVGSAKDLLDEKKIPKPRAQGSGGKVDDSMYDKRAKALAKLKGL